MHLQTKLIEKNIKENYTILPGDIEIHSFYFPRENPIKYALTLRHLNSLKQIIRHQIEKNIEIENEKFSIAGGSVLTLIMYGTHTLIKDVDLFPCSKADYLSLKKKLDESAKKEKIDVFENGNSRSYKFKTNTIDLIKKFSPDLVTCLNNFDLNVVKMGFDEKYYFKTLVKLEDVFNFKLSSNSTVTPENAFNRLRRMFKYAAKGFEIRKTDLMDIYAVIKSGSKKYETYEGVATGNVNKAFMEAFNEALQSQKEGYHDLVDNITLELPIKPEKETSDLAERLSKYKTVEIETSYEL
jgi:hypothetical protein